MAGLADYIANASPNSFQQAWNALSNGNYMGAAGSAIRGTAEAPFSAAVAAGGDILGGPARIVNNAPAPVRNFVSSFGDFGRALLGPQQPAQAQALPQPVAVQPQALPQPAAPTGLTPPSNVPITTLSVRPALSTPQVPSLASYLPNATSVPRPGAMAGGTGLQLNRGEALTLLGQALKPMSPVETAQARLIGMHHQQYLSDLANRVDPRIAGQELARGYKDVLPAYGVNHEMLSGGNGYPR